MKIFVVRAISGSHSDRYEWALVAYRSEEQAQALCDIAELLCRAYKRNHHPHHRIPPPIPPAMDDAEIKRRWLALGPFMPTRRVPSAAAWPKMELEPDMWDMDFKVDECELVGVPT